MYISWRNTNNIDRKARSDNETLTTSGEEGRDLKQQQLGNVLVGWGRS